jgi:hypothetical protein
MFKKKLLIFILLVMVFASSGCGAKKAPVVAALDSDPTSTIVNSCSISFSEKVMTLNGTLIGEASMWLYNNEEYISGAEMLLANDVLVENFPGWSLYALQSFPYEKVSSAFKGQYVIITAPENCIPIFQ